MRRARIAALVLATLGVCAVTTAPVPPPVVDVLLGKERRTLPLSELAAMVTLPAGEDIRVQEIGRDSHSSHHLVAIRTGETPHRHDRHELVVVMVRGHGSWLLGSEVRSVGAGSILYVPRGTLHAFRNESSSPAIAYAVYMPPFDGEDRVTDE